MEDKPVKQSKQLYTLQVSAAVEVCTKGGRKEFHPAELVQASQRRTQLTKQGEASAQAWSWVGQTN